MKTEIHLFLSSEVLKRRFIYKYVYMPYGLKKAGLLWLSCVKRVLLFKAIHKVRFVFLLHATPPFLALAHFLLTLLHTFITAHSPFRRSLHPGALGLQNLLDYTEVT